jgi:hypothetical protein
MVQGHCFTCFIFRLPVFMWICDPFDSPPNRVSPEPLCRVHYKLPVTVSLEKCLAPVPASFKLNVSLSLSFHNISDGNETCMRFIFQSISGQSERNAPCSEQYIEYSYFPDVFSSILHPWLFIYYR